MHESLDNFCQNSNKNSGLIVVTLWFIVSFLTFTLFITNEQESTCTSSQVMLCSEVTIESVLSKIHEGEKESDANDHISYNKNLTKLSYSFLDTNLSTTNSRYCKWLRPLQQAPPYYSSLSFTA